MSFECEKIKDRAMTSFTLYGAYRSFAPHKQYLTSQIRSRIEYLLPSDSIIVLDWHFNLTKKYIFIRRL